MLENPIILAALICFLLGLLLSGLVRLVRSSAIASTVLPIIFLASYVLTYQQVPTFPPVGSTNKIFYIALAAALIGFALDLLPRTANYRKLLAAIMPLLIVGWIGLPRFAKPDVELRAGPMARRYCLAVAPRYRCGFAGRAKWRQYRRHRDADGAPARVRAGGIARRFFHQLNAMPRSGRWTCCGGALGACRSTKRL